MEIYVAFEDFSEFLLERVDGKRRIQTLRDLLNLKGVALQTFDEKDPTNRLPRTPCSGDFCAINLRPQAGEPRGFEGEALEGALLAVGALRTLGRAAGATFGFGSEREQRALRAVGALIRRAVISK